MLSFARAPRRDADFEAVREAHHAAINECSVTRLTGYTWESAHSTALVRYLSATTGIRIADHRTSRQRSALVGSSDR